MLVLRMLLTFGVPLLVFTSKFTDIFIVSSVTFLCSPHHIIITATSSPEVLTGPPYAAV